MNDASGNITLGGKVTTNTVTSAAATALSIQSAGTTAMTVGTSQDVGIGVTPVATQLNTIQSTYGALTGNSEVNIAGNAYYNSGWKYVGTGLATQYRQSAGVHYWSTAVTGTAGGTVSFSESMRIDSSGNLLVGTTSNNGTITSFNASASGRAGFFMINAASSLSADAVGISKYDNNTTTSQIFVKFFINNNAAASGYITANGANQAAFTSSSDSRLKENITSLPPQLRKICALKPCEFDYKDGTGHQVGFIAQEMREVYPDCVGENTDGMFLISGWSKTEACLVSAIQELKAQNDALTARVAALEAKQ